MAIQLICACIFLCVVFILDDVCISCCVMLVIYWLCGVCSVFAVCFVARGPVLCGVCVCSIRYVVFVIFV
jgi:hypothetical protein